MKRCALLLLLIATLNASAAEIINTRGGLDNTFRKLINGERTVIAYFGGSITAGAGSSKPEFCYRSLLTKHLKEQFPKAQIIEVNAAIGGTGSWLGAFRLRKDVLEQKPDLVIVEFAVNDGTSPEAQVYASMEGIARQIRAANPQTDILHVYTLVKGHLEAFKKGELPERMHWHEKIAAHYGIPSVNMAQYAAAKIIAGELTIEEFAKDFVHPTDRGYALYLDALKPFIEQCKTSAEKAPAPKTHVMPAPFTERHMQRAQMVSYEKTKFDDKWKAGQESPVDKFTHVLAGDTPGATISISFKGDSLGYFDAIGLDTGDLELSVDGGEWKPRSNWDQWCKSFRSHSRVVVENLDPNTVHEVKLRIAEAQPPESKGRFFRVGWFLVNGEVVAEDPHKGLSPLEKIDAIYAAMQPVKFTPAPERWAMLPNTMKKLSEGPALKIVMLGDSIVNDTSSSKYELLLGRMYPKCKIEKVTSVRGSTGCWWYKDENRVKEYVLDHKPDLLMIGGISQRDDIESIREVIKQVRGAQPVEVLLMTGAFGLTDPKKSKDWTFEVNSNGTDYRAKLMKLAVEEKCEFLDMTGPWGQYIREADKARGWFMRDPIHANERGFQILGRILEKFFAPKVTVARASRP